MDAPQVIAMYIDRDALAAEIGGENAWRQAGINSQIEDGGSGILHFDLHRIADGQHRS